MKTSLRNLFLFLVFFTASLAYGAVPQMKVTVFNSNGGVAFTGRTDSNGTFTTASLAPGHYIVQFNSNNAALSDNTYALVVSAGNTKMVANAVSGKMFARGGVAMKMNIGTGLNITGQIASETGADGNAKVMVWIPTMPGSNMPGHWAEKGSAEEVLSRTRGIIQRYSLVKMQDHNDVGH